MAELSFAIADTGDAGGFLRRSERRSGGGACGRLGIRHFGLCFGDGLLDIENPEHGVWSMEADARAAIQNYLFSKGPSIAGGASNIQRNIIGERGLGLPRDVRKNS